MSHSPWNTFLLDSPNTSLFRHILFLSSTDAPSCSRTQKAGFPSCSAVLGLLYSHALLRWSHPSHDFKHLILKFIPLTLDLSLTCMYNCWLENFTCVSHRRGRHLTFKTGFPRDFLPPPNCWIHSLICWIHVYCSVLQYNQELLWLTTAGARKT